MSLVLAGCGSDSGGDATAPTYNVAGSIAARGTLMDAPVCIDLNQNYQCDADEPSSTSDNSGNFTLTSTNRAILTSNIVAQIEQAGGQTLRIAAPGQGVETGNTLNGVTTLVAGLVVDGKTVEEAEEIIKAQLTDAGIDLSSSVLTMATKSELAELDQNSLNLLEKFQSSQLVQGVALLAQSLSYQDKSLATELLTEEEIAAFNQEIASVVTQTVGSNDTGAVLYFADGDSDTTEAPASYPGQDAAYGFDNTDKQAATGAGFKFVKLNSAGEQLDADATEWACTLDQRTGLVWENKSADANSVQFKDRVFVFESETFKPYYEDLEVVGCVAADDGICSTSQYTEHMNKQSLCGISDWRIPTYQEFYDVLDLGETAKDKNDNVYGLNITYFPHQGNGSPDVESGAIWLDDFTFNNYAVYNYVGALQFPVVATKGADRGYVSFVEIYSDKVERDTGTSYQFPIRLVALQEQK